VWKVKKTLVEKYRPDDVLNVSELKGNQDNLDIFEELAAIDCAYHETNVTLGSQDVIGALFSAAPENYHHVLNIIADMKGSKLDIDDLKNAMYKMWHQGGGKLGEMTKRMRLYYRH
jgi:hypothetical protein